MGSINMGLHTSDKYRQKRLRPGDDNIIAFDLSLLSSGNEEALKEEYKKSPVEKRQKMLTALFAVYGCAEIARRLGINEKTVRRARKKYPEIETAALMARNLSIAEISERKAFELISSINVGKVEDREKARSAKLLADVADLQYGQVGRMKDGGEEIATEELIYRVKRKIRHKPENSDDKDSAIDITGEMKIEGD